MNDFLGSWSRYRNGSILPSRGGFCDQPRSWQIACSIADHEASAWEADDQRRRLEEAEKRRRERGQL